MQWIARSGSVPKRNMKVASNKSTAFHLQRWSYDPCFVVTHIYTWRQIRISVRVHRIRARSDLRTALASIRVAVILVER